MDDGERFVSLAACLLTCLTRLGLVDFKCFLHRRRLAGLGYYGLYGEEPL